MTERPERDKLCSSAFPVSEAITLFAQQPTVFLLTAALLQALERRWVVLPTDYFKVTRKCITASCSQTTSLTSPLWGRAAVVQSVTNIYDFIRKCQKLQICFVYTTKFLALLLGKKIGHYFLGDLCTQSFC